MSNLLDYNIKLGIRAINLCDDYTVPAPSILKDLKLTSGRVMENDSKKGD